jgi:hypothetical protein
VDATCNYQSVGTLAQKWRLSTYKSKNCINKVYDVTHSGFGTLCLNFPNNVESFIFSVGSGYTGINLDGCRIFFTTGDTCSGTQVGRSDGEWKLSSLSAKGRTMGSAEIDCTKLFRREEGGVEAGEDKKFVRGEDGEWYEEVADGHVVKARLSDDEHASVVEEDAAVVDEAAVPES